MYKLKFLITQIRQDYKENKIVLQFYETPASTLAGSNKRKARIPIPLAPISGIFASLRQAAGNSNVKQSRENRASLIFQTIDQQVSGRLNLGDSMLSYISSKKTLNFSADLPKS